MRRTYRKKSSLARLATFAFAMMALARPAFAGSGYIETAFGYGSLTNTDPFFKTGGPATASGFTFNMSMFASVFGNATELQLGVVNKLLSASADGSSLTYNVPYPELRIQLSRLFVGVGYSPYVMNSLESFQAVQGASALAFDAGILFPIVPIFSMAAYGSMTQVSGVTNAPTSKDFGVMLRFYFTVTQSQGGSSSEYKGWRYPFGKDIW